MAQVIIYHKLRHRRRLCAPAATLDERLTTASPSDCPTLKRALVPLLAPETLGFQLSSNLTPCLSSRLVAMVKQYEGTHTANRAKTGAGRRAIDARLPKVIETPKSLLALKGHSTSAVCTAVLNEIHALKKPYCRKLQRKNEVLPFEAGGEVHLENLARLNDCALFALVNHTKKRPHNLILGRTFGFRILDMIEFGVTNFTPAASFPNVKSLPGSKPLILFNGEDFDSNSRTRELKSLLLDIFRGPDDVKALNLSGVDRAIVFTLEGDSRVKFRHYAIELKKDTSSTLPKVVLKEAGPRFDLEVRRSQEAPEGLLKESFKKAKDPRVGHKTKNVSRDEMGDKKGRVHVGRQDLSNLVLARMKGLNKKKRGSEDVDADEKEEGERGDTERSDDEQTDDREMASSPRKRQKISSRDS